MSDPRKEANSSNLSSAVERLLARYQVRWLTDPYRIVVDTRQEIIVQAGPSFDLRESALKGAKEGALAQERKRTQRAA